MGYLFKSSYYQLALLAKKERLERALKDPDINDETKRKILLVQDVKKFAEEKIGLVHTRNYDSFVLLDDKYVVYAVTGSYKDKLESYQWSFPIVGTVPYKGFFKKKDAEEEKQILEKQDFDSAMRGVSAYSTLGWFADPLLSSMTAYEDQDLVETVIHETTHATLYIKSNADFNERLANFVGIKGMEQYYSEIEGSDSKKVQRAKDSSQDSKTFAEFMSKEINDLEAFYKSHKGSPTLLTDRLTQFEKIKEDFKTQCQPKLKTANYSYFPKLALNNAVLIGYKTYYQDLDVFQKAFDKLKTWKAFFDYFKTLKKSQDPESDLKKFLI